MPRKRGGNDVDQSRPIEQYDHQDKQRANNPPVGLVSGDNDALTARRTYAYDPHLDPSLEWAGKAEHTSFEISTVSLHVHERIDPRTIIEAAQSNGADLVQGSLFATPSENPPLGQALEFYKHSHGWTNRLIAGDSLLVMNSLLDLVAAWVKNDRLGFDIFNFWNGSVRRYRPDLVARLTTGTTLVANPEFSLPRATGSQPRAMNVSDRLAVFKAE